MLRVFEYVSVFLPFKFAPYHPTNGEVYSIQHYVIKFVSDLRQVGGFSPGTPFTSTNKTDRDDITEIHALLKLALNTINQTLKQYSKNHVILIYVVICKFPRNGFF